MTEKHTKGPWQASLTIPENDSPYWAIIGTPNGLEDEFPHKGAFIGKITGKRERQEHNARLIAAAPDLLEALEKVIDYHVTGINPLSDAAILSARAAIAKAKHLDK